MRRESFHRRALFPDDFFSGQGMKWSLRGIATQTEPERLLRGDRINQAVTKLKTRPEFQSRKWIFETFSGLCKFAARVWPSGRLYAMMERGLAPHFGACPI
jgi:hypothetical protein